MTEKIKIVSGWTNPGGSTTAFINLCNLFNENGIDCTFYGPHDWHIGRCKSGKMDQCRVNEEGEIVLVHFLKFPVRPDESKKVILACHDKEIYPVKDIKQFWDDVVYVSNSQMFWQGVSGTVIPNVISNLEKSGSKSEVAGVIGSIDRNKNTHESIHRALEDGHSKVVLYGIVTDTEYYEEHVEKYVDSGKAELRMYEDNKQKMYNSLGVVYHSSLSETFNFIKAECDLTGTEYLGLESSESGAEYWNNEKILEKLKTRLGI